jgi:hypothetical protein
VALHCAQVRLVRRKSKIAKSCASLTSTRPALTGGWRVREDAFANITQPEGSTDDRCEPKNSVSQSLISFDSDLWAS